MTLQEVIFFFDDSGVFHKNAPETHFVYAGYVFTSRRELNDARRKYINANKKLRKKLKTDKELKAAYLKNRHKRSLFNVVKEYDSVAVVVDLDRIYDYIICNKKSVCRYKDYVLKRCVKSKLESLIADGTISKDEDIKVSIYIDEQLTATNGYYDLRDSIMEELQHGIFNFDYGVVHANVFDSEVKVEIQYCNSEKNYMIQASDILANRIWNSYKRNKKEWRIIENHNTLTFP